MVAKALTVGAQYCYRRAVFPLRIGGTSYARDGHGADQ